MDIDIQVISIIEGHGNILVKIMKFTHNSEKIA